MPLKTDPDTTPPSPQFLRTVTVLGIVMIFSWGSSFYLPGIFHDPMAGDTGWSAAQLSAGFSLGLLVSGLASPRVGTLIQRHGGRRVLAVGMALIALGQVVMAMAHSLPVYLLAWIITGLGMGAGLYDAAFSALGRLYGEGARGAITALTLFGGFASTVCWPISAVLVEYLGWRGALLAYAGFHVLVTIPLCLWGLPRAETPHATVRGGGDGALGWLYRDPRFWLVALAGMCFSAMASVLTLTLIPILTGQGLTLAAAVGIGALFGPAQVAARVIEMAGRGRHHPIWTMAVSAALALAGMVALWAGLAAGAAVMAFGAGNGLWSIARGSLPLAVFGAADYPRIMGRIAPLALIASAAGPWVAGMISETFGAEGALAFLVALAVIPPGLTVALALRLRRGHAV
ncbi:MFS transporter [Pseudooceanicola sp.]|uniref:MFS transporter n=1 Tax=Pseudooceanicola sp. TaxID=1914328 RepID=UPI0035C685DA